MDPPHVTKANKMKEYHLSMSQKKPINTITRDVSHEKMPKKKIKKAKNNRSKSPGDKTDNDKEMPYNGTGTINIGLGE